MFEVLVVYDWIFDKTLFHSERTVVLRTQWKQNINRPWRLTHITNNVCNNVTMMSFVPTTCCRGNKSKVTLA